MGISGHAGHLEQYCWRTPRRQNLYSTDKPSITQIVEEANENLFNSIRYNTSHHQLLPRQTESSYNFELSHIHDDRNFIDRMLYYPYYNA